MRFNSIILLSILTAVVYGVLHDQVTARVCVEYFTIGHPPVFDTEDPTLLGLGWGVIATWWVGLMLGVPLALAARAGGWPKVGPRRLVRPLVIMLSIVGSLALIAGLVGHAAAARGSVHLVGPLAEQVPPGRHVAFLTDLWAHLASYAGGFLGGIVQCVVTLVRRARMAAALKLARTATVLALIALVAGCKPSGPTSTHTTSAAMPTLAARVAFVQEYVTFRRTYETLDFDVNYTNNGGGGVPGPSDWDVRLVATVPAGEVAAWVPPGVARSAGPVDRAWLKTVPTSLDLSGVDEWYEDGRRVVGVDRGRRIVAYRSWKN